MNEPLDIMESIRGDLPFQRKMYSTYVGYMVRKGCSRDEIWTFSQWQEHFDFPVTDEPERISGQRFSGQRFYGRKTGQYFSWTKGPRANS